MLSPSGPTVAVSLDTGKIGGEDTEQTSYLVCWGQFCAVPVGSLPAPALHGIQESYFCIPELIVKSAVIDSHNFNNSVWFTGLLIWKEMFNGQIL